MESGTSTHESAEGDLEDHEQEEGESQRAMIREEVVRAEAGREVGRLRREKKKKRSAAARKGGSSRVG